MANALDAITSELRQFIEGQHLFFVATAPMEPDGHVNVSPKGMDTFRVLSPNRVAYLDLTGSGNETSAHLLQNGRITLMFCAFSGKPRILRLYGHGRTVLPGASEWPELVAHFASHPGIRQIIIAQITRVQTSCGFGVPLLTFEGDRDALAHWAEAKGDDGLVDYRRRKNSRSIDGLPAPLAEQL